MDAKILAQYATLSMQIKDLEAQRSALKENLISEFKSDGVEKVENDFGTFTTYPVTTWKYSPVLVKKEEAIKIAKIKEQEKGIAKAKTSDAFRFTPRKESDE